MDGLAEVRATGTADGLVRIEATLKDVPDSDAVVDVSGRIWWPSKLG
ncbi:hypothetical protein [Lentzea nigeriaca]|nr:hypothetical protein [Lentzea nigeriaca]MBM7859052.1 hypothetical protein [Lentzea nigeriaca]